MTPRVRATNNFRIRCRAVGNAKVFTRHSRRHASYLSLGVNSEVLNLESKEMQRIIQTLEINKDKRELQEKYKQYIG